MGRSGMDVETLGATARSLAARLLPGIGPDTTSAAGER